MKILGIIPARFASSRFPGKPLVKIMGKTMIRRVYEQALKAKTLSDIVVATDDERIASEVESFGGKYIMTSRNHLSGTDRCAEAAKNFENLDIIINIQGDEPFIDPSQIDLLASCFEINGVKVATLIKKINTDDDLFNHNIPKVIVNTKFEAMYFSRQTIPFMRNENPDNWLTNNTFYKHIGIYGYAADTIQELTKLAPSYLESSESLEQLRWIENGFTIQTKVTDIETIAIDTPQDLEKLTYNL